MTATLIEPDAAGAVRDTRRRPWWLFPAALAVLLLVILLLVLSATGGGSRSTKAAAPAAPPEASSAPVTSVDASSPNGGLVGGSSVVPAPAKGTLVIPEGLGTGLFIDDKAGLTPNARAVIAQAAAYIKELRPAMVTTTGYTDEVGGRPENRALSLQRAGAFSMAVKLAVGPGPTVYRITGRGENFPAATNDTPEGRQLNRRATMQIG